MNVTRLRTPEEFARHAMPLLLEREAENNLVIGLLERLDKPDEALFYVVRDGDDRVVAAALQTDPEHNLLLSHISDEAVDALAAELTRDGMTLRGVQGSAAAVDRFAARWMRYHAGVAARPGTWLGIYEITRVTPPIGVPGEMHLAREEDVPLVAEWIGAFNDELQLQPPQDLEARARQRIAAGAIHLWRDGGQFVSIAAGVGRTASGIRIGLVYTPPPLRRRGYAGALVAALSQKLLDSGRRFCFLFTDMTNPTSNKIYQQLGYVKVCEQRQMLFESGGAL